jgi:hypothetical protein
MFSTSGQNFGDLSHHNSENLREIRKSSQIQHSEKGKFKCYNNNKFQVFGPKFQKTFIFNSTNKILFSFGEYFYYLEMVNFLDKICCVQMELPISIFMNNILFCHTTKYVIMNGIKKLKKLIYTKNCMGIASSMSLFANSENSQLGNFFCHLTLLFQKLDGLDSRRIFFKEQ